MVNKSVLEIYSNILSFVNQIQSIPSLCMIFTVACDLDPFPLEPRDRSCTVA